MLNILMVAISVVSALALAEGYFRLVDPQPIVPRYVETSSYGIRQNIPDVRGELIVPEYQHDFSTNSQGFRGTTEYALPKPPGVFRIIVLGDSATLGHGVGDRETFSFLLQEQLSLIRPTEVINMGVSGFGTAEELIQLRYVGWTYQPDAVILGYFPNDPYNNVVSRLFKLVEGQLLPDREAFVPALYVRDRLYKIPGWSFLCQHSHVVNFIRLQLSGFFQRRLGQLNGIETTIPETLTPDVALLTTALLRELAMEAERHGVPLIVLNIPTVLEGQVVANFPEHTIEPLSLRHLIHLHKEWEGRHTLQDLFYQQDAHPNRFAHRLAADCLTTYMLREIWKIEREKLPA